MTIVALQPRAGIFTDDAEGSNDRPLKFVDGNLVRFVSGKAETIGGWQAKTASQFSGKVRALMSSSQLDGTRNIFAGSHSHLQVLTGGTIADITPVSGSPVAIGTDGVSVTSGSPTVTVTSSGHGLVVGQQVVVAGASGTVGSLTINGAHTVVTSADSSTYTYTDGSNASASATGGGASMTGQKILEPGAAIGTFEYGYGVLGYGESTWDTARSSSDVILDPRVWSIESYGEDALACPGAQGAVYHWDATNGTTTRAVAVTGAPPCNFIVVNPASRHLITFGADGDPMKIRWASQGTLTTWTASATNDAGDIRLLDGSEIRAAKRLKSEILIWTDTSVYSFRYVGGTFVFSLTKLADAAPVLGQQAVAGSDAFAVWMSDGQFQAYDGTVRSLPCPVLRHVFDADRGPGINLTQRDLIIGFSNAEYGEVGFFYPSAGSDEIDRVVVWNFTSGPDVWWIGELSRTAYIDRAIELQPTGVDADGTVYDHEIPGAGDNGSPIAYSVQTGGAFVQQGEDLYHVRQAIPDFVLTDSNASNALSLQFFARIFPQGPETSDSPSSIISTTEVIDTRITGRQIAWRASSNSNQLQWRLGTIRFDVEQLDAAR
jgi:hypothetical protein